MHTTPAQIAAASATACPARTLLDLMYDGFYALFMLKNGSGPHDNTEFISKTTQFLDDFEPGMHGAVAIIHASRPVLGALGAGHRAFHIVM